MIGGPAGARVWLASGPTDMRRGMNSLALQVQEVLKLNPHGGDLFVFRGRRGHLVKVLWADGLGMSLYIKRMERAYFVWSAPAVRDGSGGQVTTLQQSANRLNRGTRATPRDAVSVSDLPATSD
ncbi:MAG: IS66 family insertion sequence element accessory protein TnpB [Reyranellaceae bacterium]